MTPSFQGNASSDRLYTGHYYHGPSGLLLAPYRAYEPTLGRWLNRDPIGERGGINLYGYVGDNPVNLVDPLGLSPATDACDKICGQGNVEACIAIRIPNTEYKHVSCKCKTDIDIKKGKTRKSPPQIETGLSPEDAIENLEQNGYTKTPFKAQNGGTGYELTNGEKTYRFYPNATSGAGDSASVSNNATGDISSKIRFNR